MVAEAMSGREVADMVTAARAGDRDALGRVLDAFRHYLLAVGRREMDLVLSTKAGASDLVQETMLEAQRDFDQFGGMSDGDVQAWLRRLLLNNVANLRRRYRGVAKRSVAREVPMPANGPAAREPWDTTEITERREAVRELIGRLADSQRHVLSMWLDNRSFGEIAVAMGKTPAAVRMLWARGVERLREEVGPRGNDE